MHKKSNRDTVLIYVNSPGLSRIQTNFSIPTNCSPIRIQYEWKHINTVFRLLNRSVFGRFGRTILFYLMHLFSFIGRTQLWTTFFKVKKGDYRCYEHTVMNCSFRITLHKQKILVLNLWNKSFPEFAKQIENQARTIPKFLEIYCCNFHSIWFSSWNFQNFPIECYAYWKFKTIEYSGNISPWNVPTTCTHFNISRNFGWTKSVSLQDTI